MTKDLTQRSVCVVGAEGGGDQKKGGLDRFLPSNLPISNSLAPVLKPSQKVTGVFYGQVFP